MTVSPALMPAFAALPLADLTTRPPLGLLLWSSTWAHKWHAQCGRG